MKLPIPPRDSRAILIGTTGSGKSTVAKKIIYNYDNVLAIDPKPSLGLVNGVGHLRGFELVRTPEDLVRAARRNNRLQYRPDPEYQSVEEYDRVLWWVFARGNTYLYVDEAYLIHRNGRATDGLRACITSGREKGIGMLTATQRPAKIDPALMSESEYGYVFQLRKREDRERVAENMESDVLLTPATGHDFYYCAPGRDPVLMRLNLSNG